MWPLRHKENNPLFFIRIITVEPFDISSTSKLDYFVVILEPFGVPMILSKLIYGPIITPTTSHHQFVVIRNVMSANPIKAVKRATVPVYKLIYVDSIQKRYSS